MTFSPAAGAQPGAHGRARLVPSRLGLVLLLAALAAACDNTLSVAPPADRPHEHPPSLSLPNIILLVLDTARADRMSFAGYERLTTPHVDALARDGVVYSQAHATAPWTLPSHMSMFTGLLPGEHGAGWQAFPEQPGMSLRDMLAVATAPAEPSRLLTARLKTYGYQTLGFTSNAWVSRRTGFDIGFDRFYELWQDRRRLRYGYGWLPPQIRTAREFDEGDAGLVLMRFKQHVLEHGLREPFFLFVNFIDPHYPYSPPPLWRQAYSTDRDLGRRIASFEFDEQSMVAGDRPIDVGRFSPFYDAELSYVDFAVGHLLSWLRERGYYDESLIVVTSDHGEHLGEDGRFSHQFSMEEELLRIPLVIKYPDNAGAGTVESHPLVSNLDLYATLLAAAGETVGRNLPTASQNLRLMDRFDRPFSIAELHYSMPYLRIHQELHPAFPLDDHRIVRRVVYGPGGKFVFGERDGQVASASAVGAADDEERLRAAAFLDEYVSGLSGDGLQQTGKPVDPETLERLQSLGYVR